MTEPVPTEFTGSCLCGTVRYRVQGGFEPVVFCHCARCRKATGSAFQAVAPLPTANFELLAGGQAIKSFESSPGVHRQFCGQCGSPLYSRRDAQPDLIRLRIGSLDTPWNTRPAMHIFTASKAPWDAILDDAPQYPTRPGE